MTDRESGTSEQDRTSGTVDEERDRLTVPSRYTDS